LICDYMGKAKGWQGTGRITLRYVKEEMHI